MKVADGVELSYEGGQGVLKAEVKDGLDAVIGSLEVKVKAAYFLNPKLDELMAKVQSGEVDLIPGTDLEKGVVLAILGNIKNEINK